MMSNALFKLSAFNTLLRSLPTRKALFQSPKIKTSESYTIRIERTSPFEFISELMSPYFSLWGADLSIQYSTYDTTLSNILVEDRIDAYIIWLDWRLYQNTMTAEQTAEWIKQRIQALRVTCTKPILLNNWFETWDNGETLFSTSVSPRGWIRALNVHLSKMVDALPGCGIIDLAGISHEVTTAFYDERNDTVSQFPFSASASMVIARHLSVHLFPAIFKPRIKVIVLDLDDTLYQGVIGEDGVDGVIFTDGHLQLQALLLRLKQSGILLTICSRNELDDVKQLFARWQDHLPLQWDDFAVICSNWQPKSENIQTIAERLNLHPSDFLFVDDNPAELVKASADYPAMRLLRAEHLGEETARMLTYYPGLYQLQTDDIAAFRTIDIQANELRDKLKADVPDYDSYLSALNMTITIFHNHDPHTKRIHELSQKTNQFNLSLKRLDAAQSEKMMSEQDCHVFTIQLKDYLSDSGVIGSFIFQLDKMNATLIELVFSCRALGREIETVAFAHCLNVLIQQGVKWLHIITVEGPRNKPALEWLARYTTEVNTSLAIYDLYEKVKASCANHPAKVDVLNDN